MNKHFLQLMAVLLSFLMIAPAMAQRGTGMGGPGMDDGMMGGQGMMGHGVAPEVPAKLPAPQNQQWVQNLRDVLALERLSYAQYTVDANKYNASMPYRMVIGQEQDHIRTIGQLFSAYGLPATSNQLSIKQTETLAEALGLCVQMEQDLAQRYEDLVNNAGDRQSAAILNQLLVQTRQHQAMFQQALRMGGGMGSMGGGMGSGMMGR